MKIKLIVRDQFGDHAKGAEINDPDIVAEVLAGEFAHNVIPVTVIESPPEDATA